MRLVKLLLLCLAGCVGTREFRGEINRMNQKDVALRSSVAELKRDLGKLESQVGAGRSELDRSEKKGQEEAAAFRSRLIKELEDLRHDFTYGLDQAISGVKGDVNRLEAEQGKAAQALREELRNGEEARRTAAIEQAILEVKKGSGELGGRIERLEREAAARADRLAALEKDFARVRSDLEALLARTASAEASLADLKRDLGDRADALEAAIKELSAKDGKPQEAKKTDTGGGR